MTVPLGLAAFADEISADLHEQIAVCKANGVTHVELRSVEGRNVLDFDDAMATRVRDALRDSGLGVISIGSPIGKVKINEPFGPHLERFRRAVELAEWFDAPLIRIFSYYPPAAGESMQPWREEVLRRMREKVRVLGDRPITLVHENEADIYGERGAACLDLMEAIDSPKLRCAFDFANFVIAGERPRDNWAILKPWTTHIHVKDATLAGKKIVPAGEGDGDIALILRDAYTSGYRGFLTLEPHLAVAGQFSGFTGPVLFGTAAEALRKVCREVGIPLGPAASTGNA